MNIPPNPKEIWKTKLKKWRQTILEGPEHPLLKKKKKTYNVFNSERRLYVQTAKNEGFQFPKQQELNRCNWIVTTRACLGAEGFT